MPIDHSIYFQQQPVDILGSIERGVSLRDLVDKRNEANRLKQEAEAKREAAKRNVIQGEDGRTSLNREGYVADLFKIDPEKAIETQRAFQANQLQDQANRLQIAKQKIDLSSQLLGSVTDQTSWDRARNEAIRLGLAEPNELPMQYDPSYVQRAQMQTLSMKDRLDEKFRRDQLAVEREKVDIQRMKARASAGRGQSVTKSLTPAQKKVDQEFAKEYNDFIARGGYADVQKNIQQLREVKSQLEQMSSATGPIVGTMGSLPFIGKPLRDVLTPTGAAMQDKVEEVVQRNLRLILGAQFTEKEGQRLIERAYNPRLSEEENARRVQALLDQIETAARAKMEAAKYYEQNGTLQGFKGVALGQTQSRQSQSPQEKTTFKTDEIEWAD